MHVSGIISAIVIGLIIGALAPGGHLVVDDMSAAIEQTRRVRDTLLAHPDLTAVELPCGTGLIPATRNR